MKDKDWTGKLNNDVWLGQQDWVLYMVVPSVLVKNRIVVVLVELVLNVLVTCCCLWESIN
uniref:Uncharacterized protein n=1 Tax=Arundo donax TaxID=35708 RepID=A0A0A8YYK5_ARUDO